MAIVIRAVIDLVTHSTFVLLGSPDSQRLLLFLVLQCVMNLLSHKEVRQFAPAWIEPNFPVIVLFARLLLLVVSFGLEHPTEALRP
jgi:hypothetical protein